MNGDAISQLVISAMPDLELARDELRDLDAALGDGDLGITVAGGAAAMAEALRGLDQPDPAAVLRAAARAFARSNPSTFSALVAAGLLAAAKDIAGRSDLDRAAAAQVLAAAAAAIQQRGGAAAGDKTVLDAMLASQEALGQAGPDDAAALDSMVKAARSAVAETAGLRSRRGRAAWVGDRSAGAADGGATAYLRFLEALATSWPGPGDQQ
ncbi:MAG TPA: DAK2 domain-containing protein [Streptosporangiaceae bacterium]|nr:DAK2 domain-containing protein [Streptosporangiaceae bacterium]